MKLSEAIERLRRSGVPDARAEGRIIFTELGKIPAYKTVGADPETDSEEVAAAISRREKREPLGYILGKVGFYNEVYEVTADTLIPRQDTEVLVEYAIDHLEAGAAFADLCTGSGCVAISVLKNTNGTKAFAVDISDGALRVADRNAELSGVSDRIELICSDVLDGPSCKLPVGLGAILANPPYVTEEEYPSLEEEIFFEPKSAFVGGEDGGDFYRAITKKYKELVSDNGFIAYEIGYRQAELLRSIADRENMSCEIIYDLSSNPRVAVLRKQKQKN